jgi:hypothetical protein
MMTPDEKLELVELLEYRTRSSFIIRRERCIAAEVRLGMWENGRFVGHGVAELVEKARYSSLFRFLVPWLERSADRYAALQNYRRNCRLQHAIDDGAGPQSPRWVVFLCPARATW